MFRLLLLNLVLATTLAACTGPDPAPVGQVPDAVNVSTDRDSYRSGEPIRVTVANGRGEPVDGRSGRTYCSFVAIEREEADGWVRAGECASLVPELRVTVPAGGEVSLTFEPSGPRVATTAVAVSDPVTPVSTDIDLRNLPTSTPVSGGPRVVPEGEAPPLTNEPVFPPGRYRAAFSFTPHDAGEPVETAYSEPFMIEP